VGFKMKYRKYCTLANIRSVRQRTFIKA
jgi:hypothetical protein